MTGRYPHRIGGGWTTHAGELTVAEVLKDVRDGDRFLRDECSLVLPGEVASGYYDHSTFSRISGAPYQYQELLGDGAEVVCCGLCVDARGIDPETDYPDGVEVGLLPDLADMLGSADRVVSL
jgi:hypothetical protein